MVCDTSVVTHYSGGRRRPSGTHRGTRRRYSSYASPKAARSFGSSTRTTSPWETVRSARASAPAAGDPWSRLVAERQGYALRGGGVTVSRWLASGLRRDVCVVVHALGEPTGQQAKARLEEHYGDRVAPDRFYGAVDALVDAGHLEERVDGIHDRYALTASGERALRAHREWLCERVAMSE